MRRAFMAAIRVYQRTLSPDHGPLRRFFPYGYCRFHPSCSQYGHDAYRLHGVARGSVLTAWRILRCNPFNEGGEDPVPEPQP